MALHQMRVPRQKEGGILNFSLSCVYCSRQGKIWLTSYNKQQTFLPAECGVKYNRSALSLNKMWWLTRKQRVSHGGQIPIVVTAFNTLTGTNTAASHTGRLTKLDPYLLVLGNWILAGTVTYGEIRCQWQKRQTFSDSTLWELVAPS